MIKFTLWHLIKFWLNNNEAVAENLKRGVFEMHQIQTGTLNES